MKKVYSIITFTLILLFSHCATGKYIDNSQNWVSSAKMNEVEIFVDTASIKKVGNMTIAKEKKVFYSAESKENHITAIKNKFTERNLKDKSEKWADFSYSIYESEYDCLNNRFRVLSIEDYDSNGTRIIKTVSNKKQLKWLNVDAETLGDYTFFYVCDYGN